MIELRIQIGQEAADAATRQAAEHGLSVTEYISLLVRRSFERSPDEEGVLVYDHVGIDDELHLDHEPGEDEESYHRRVALYSHLFGRSG